MNEPPRDKDQENEKELEESSFGLPVQFPEEGESLTGLMQVYKPTLITSRS